MRKGIVALLIVAAVVFFTVIFLSKIKVKPGINYNSPEFVPAGVTKPTYLGPSAKRVPYVPGQTTVFGPSGEVIIVGPGTATAPSSGAKPTYAQALKIYRASGYYLQFDNCRGNPGILTLKKGAKFMLDNRDPLAIKIGLSGKNYLISKYNFTIVTAEKIGTNYVTCNGGGAAQIKVQP